MRIEQIVGGPPWVNRELFEVLATFDPEKLTEELPTEPIGAYPGVPPAVTLMMRTLLQERFGLRTHVEERTINVIAVLLANADGQLGPNLRRSRSECPIDSRMFSVCGIPVRDGRPPFYEAVALTGLEGLFDFELPVYKKGEPRRGDSIFSVVEKQHGLKLERRRVQGRFLHIDAIRQPSSN